MAEKVLKRSVSGLHPESGPFSYEAGTAASDMEEGHAEFISNPKAWEDRTVEDEDFGVIPEGMTRSDFVNAANANAASEGGGVSTGGDFEDMTVPQLRQYALDNEIELGEATRKADIIKAIEDAGNG